MSYISKTCSHLLEKYAQEIDLTVNTLVKQADQLQRAVQHLVSQLAVGSAAATGRMTPQDIQTLNGYDASVSNLIKNITTTYPQYRENKQLMNAFNMANQTYSLITKLVRTFNVKK